MLRKRDNCPGLAWQIPVLPRARLCQHGFVKRYGLVRDDRLHRLWCSFGEVQQDLLLSCLTIG